MSRISRMIEVSAPCMRVDRESLTLHGLSCGYCQGNGYFWGLDEMGQGEKKPCPICKGKGVLDAEVTIRYRAAASSGVLDGRANDAVASSGVQNRRTNHLDF